MAGTANASPIIAARYASALFDIADERHTLDQIEGDLQTLKRLLADNADLRAALRNPMYSSHDQGKAVVVISSYLPEILALSDRILVSRQGKVVEEFSALEATEERIMHAAVY